MILHAFTAVLRFWYQFLRMIIAGVIQSCLVGWLEIIVGFFFCVCAHNRYENNQSLRCSSEETFQLRNNPPPPFLFCYTKLTELWMREQVLVGKQRLHSDTDRLLSPFVCHRLSSLVAATTHVPNHSFLVQLGADWLRAVHTPDTPPMKSLLRFLALASGFSARAIRGLHLYPTSVNPYTHKINI